jgi:hypothetical protein
MSINPTEGVFIVFVFIIELQKVEFSYYFKKNCVRAGSSSRRSRQLEADEQAARGRRTGSSSPSIGKLLESRMLSSPFTGAK